MPSAVVLLCALSFLEQELLSSGVLRQSCTDAIGRGLQWPHHKVFPVLSVLRAAAKATSPTPCSCTISSAVC